MNIRNIRLLLIS